MSETRKLLEDENISVEYAIINGLVCINKIYLKEAKTEEAKIKTYKEVIPLNVGDTYHYTNDDGFEYGLPDLEIDYTILSEYSFICKIKSVGIIDFVDISDKNLLAFMLWFSLDFIEDVTINANEDLEVVISTNFKKERNLKLDRELFNSISAQLIDEMERYSEKKDNKEYITEILDGLSTEHGGNFKKALELASKI
jgi:hypothetical protein